MLGDICLLLFADQILNIGFGLSHILEKFPKPAIRPQTHYIFKTLYAHLSIPKAFEISFAPASIGPEHQHFNPLLGILVRGIRHLARYGPNG